MSDLDDKDFAIRAPYIQRIWELESELAETKQKFEAAKAHRFNLLSNAELYAAEMDTLRL